MQFTPDYIITRKDGSKVNLLFNSWMYRAYSYKKNIELEDLFVNIQKGVAFKSRDLPDLLLIAAETYAKYNNAPFGYTEMDACLWVDEMGGYNSANLVELYKIFVSRLINVDQAEFEILWNKVINGEGEREQKPANGKKKAVTKN